jgi:thiamine-monophosphate kinase
VDEFELIRRYFLRDRGAPGVVVGVGDDGAVLEPEPGRELVAVVDTLVEGVHFPRDIGGADLGFRSVEVNLSDIAAMGARPRWMTLALTIPEADERWLEGFSAGLAEAAGDVALVGGDTTRGNEVVVSVQIIGDVEAGRALLRSGARAGDTVFVTGTLGDAAGGLELISSGRSDAFLSLRYLRPCAHVRFGQSLVGRASAAIDVSDGLVADLGKLLAASGVGAEIDVERVPVSDALKAHFDERDRRRLALSGGDDYELVFTGRREDIPDSSDVRVTAIGTIVAGDSLTCRERGNVVDCGDGGYDHFR